jgi:hypothetical protein
MEPLQTNTQTRDPVQTSRPTIGFLIYAVNTAFGVNLWRGGVEAARDHGANFVCFAGDVIHPAISPGEYGFEFQANILYELINPERFDGLVFCSNVLLALIQLEEFKRFCARYRPLPMISIAVPVEGLACLMVDNYAGMYAAVSHLINVHGYRGLLKIIGQHEELLVVRQGGQIERVDTVDLGFPLGLEENIAAFVAEATVSLQPGESIVLYTDGITEAENADHQLYGIERLCDVVSRHWDQSAEAIKQAVIDDVTRYIGQQKVHDDLTLVVLKQK